jgi:predicted O-methyltransferase YrrM
MTVHDVVARLSDDPAQDTGTHYAVLYSIARFLPARLALEIGVDDGSTTLPLLLGVAEHGGQLFSVDPAPCEAAKLVVAQSGHADHWHFAQCKSADVVSKIPDGTLDLIWIDGDHSADGVATDWRLFAPKVRVGGLVLFHDALNLNEFPGIARLIETQIRPQWEEWGVAQLNYGWGLTLCERLRSPR